MLNKKYSIPPCSGVEALKQQTLTLDGKPYWVFIWYTDRKVVLLVVVYMQRGELCFEN